MIPESSLRPSNWLVTTEMTMLFLFVQLVQLDCIGTSYTSKSFCRPRTQFFQAEMRHNQHTHKATHVYVYINQLRISLNCWKPLVLDVTTIISTKRAHCFSVQSYLYKITRVHSCTPQVCTPQVCTPQVGTPQVSCRKKLYHAAKVCTMPQKFVPCRKSLYRKSCTDTPTSPNEDISKQDFIDL